MVIREAAAAIVVGSLASEKLSQDEIRFLKTEKIPGITLFKRNIPPVLSDLKSNIILPLQNLTASKSPLIIAVDQEGGRVSRLASPFPNKGCAFKLAGNGSSPNDLDEIQKYGVQVGLALNELGINTNFAPVVDILSNPLNIGIGDRSFGLNAEAVSLRAGAFLDGMQSTGVWGCLKHFPGQGSELTDPHEESVVISIRYETLRDRELVPYKKLLDQAQMVMVSHCIYPDIDTQPGTLSYKIMTQLLKEDLKYSGLVVSDDMNMKAISQDFEKWGQSLIRSVSAGADLLLVCSGLDRWQKAIDVLESEAKQSKSFEKRLLAAAEKVEYFRQTARKRV